MCPAPHNGAMLAPFFAAALAAMTPQEAVDTHAYLIGSWNCTFTVGDQGGYYTTTWSRALDGMWLKQSYDQPKQPRAEAFKAEYFVGYDPRFGQWVRMGAMTTGQYFIIRMADTPDGWGWKYVSAFRPPRPDNAAFDTVFSRKSDTYYTVDGPTYRSDKGVMETEHHQCRKAASS